MKGNASVSEQGSASEDESEGEIEGVHESGGEMGSVNEWEIG